MSPWFVLLHTAGPAIGEGENVFEHPGIAEHFAFLRRLDAAGVLIAAGPFDDVRGEGMTVIATDDLVAAERLATGDDQAVVNGVLAVRVRPWNVLMGSAAPTT